MTIINSYGGPDSNSYIDISQANSFIMSAVFDNDAWQGLTKKEKESLLVMATYDIDSRQFVGHRFFYDQHLEFPRQLRSAFPFNRTSAETISQDVYQKRMRRNVQEACAWQAAKLARDCGRNKHLENIANGVTQVSEQVGPIREVVQYGKTVRQSTAKFDPNALSLLQPWMTDRKVYRK